MVKGIACLLILFALFISTVPVVDSRPLRPELRERLRTLDQQERARERANHDRTRLLRQSIRRRWTPEQVSRRLGPPERRQVLTEGADTIEVWGYEGFDIRIRFRNGLAEDWFFRFMD